MRQRKSDDLNYLTALYQIIKSGPSQGLYEFAKRRVNKS